MAELSAYAGISTYAITMTTPELGIAVTVFGGVVGVIVWLVRLEGRINTQGEILLRLERHLESSEQRGAR